MKQNMRHFQSVKFDKAERTPQGFLRMPAYLTRTGVFRYMMKDGSILRELRHPDDVFKPESLATLVSLPLTNEHPNKLVDPTTIKKETVGWLGDKIDIESIYLKAMVTVADVKAIDDVESGKQELSCGYTADLMPEKGIFNGEEYDVRQTNIVYNHVSLVKRGRAGANVKLHLDADDAVEEFIEDKNSSEEGKMAKMKIGNKEFDVAEDVKDAFEKALKEKTEECDGLQAKMSDMVSKKEVEKLQGKKDAADAEIVQLKTKLDSAGTDQAVIDAKVKSRVELLSQASKVLKPEVKTDGLSDVDVKKEVIKAKRPTMNLDGKSDSYVEAAFDQIMIDVSADAEAQAALNAKNTPAAGGANNQSEPVSATDARKKMIADSQAAWKTPSEVKA